MDVTRVVDSVVHWAASMVDMRAASRVGSMDVTRVVDSAVHWAASRVDTKAASRVAWKDATWVGLKDATMAE